MLEPTGQRRIDVAYLAGLVDGEGCFLFNGGPHLRVESTSRCVIEKMHEVFGGSCAVAKRKTALNRIVFMWSAYGPTASSIAEELAEFLIDKRIQAILMSRIQKYPPGSAMRESIKIRLKSIKRAAS